MKLYDIMGSRFVLGSDHDRISIFTTGDPKHAALVTVPLVTVPLSYRVH